jgi:hypothetical protein
MIKGFVILPCCLLYVNIFTPGERTRPRKIAMFLQFQDPRMPENGLFTAFFARQG